jgi:hypothetical protein
VYRSHTVLASVVGSAGGGGGGLLSLLFLSLTTITFRLWPLSTHPVFDALS